MQDLFRALPALMKEFYDNETVREAVTFATWRKITGESIGENAVPFRLFKKHLIIAVRHETWKRHLERLSGEMIFKLNSALGSAVVTFIEFRVDERTVESQRGRNKRQTISEEELKEIALDEVSPNLRRAADAIKDDNLRYQFLLAAGSCLARKKKLKE